jgi:LacI family transcriptional regulator
MAATVRDIAQQAGVSPATVSLVLNRRPGVGEETRSLVLKIADELGYSLPSSRRRKDVSTIRLLKIARHGHIINRDHNVFISDYIDGIEQEAREHGYALEVQSYKGFDADQLIRELNQCEAVGAVVLATELRTEDIPLFQQAEIPLVFIDGTHPFAPFDFIDMDNEGAVFSIVSHFVESGHREIGIVGSSMETRNFRAREDAFHAALDYHGLKAEKDYIFKVDSTFEQSFWIWTGFWRRGDVCPAPSSASAM